MIWNSEETKPTKSGVYRTRTTIRSYIESSEVDIKIVDGYSYYDHAVKRWGLQSIDPILAKQRKYTTGFRFRSDQEKEWAVL